MAEEDGLVALQGFHSDLVAFSENRLQDIERLVNELDGRIEEFRALLDKKGKADASRKLLQDGASTMALHAIAFYIIVALALYHAGASNAMA